MSLLKENPSQRRNFKLFKACGPVKKPRAKRKGKYSFLRLNKKLLYLLHSLTNRQNQFLFCLLWLTDGGSRPINKHVRYKAQKSLGIGWQGFFKMMRILKAKKFVFKVKNGLTGDYQHVLISNLSNKKKFLMVPVKTESGHMIFQKGFDLQTYFNGIEKADRHPKQACLPEICRVAKRTKRHRAANMARKALILKGRQKSKAHIESKDFYRTTQAIHTKKKAFPTKNQAPLQRNLSLKPLFKENSYMFHKTIGFFDWRMSNPWRSPWTKTRIVIKNRHKMLATQNMLCLPRRPCLYKETTEQERIDIFAPLKIPAREKPWSYEKSMLHSLERCLETQKTIWKIRHCPKIRKETELRAADLKRRIARLKQSLNPSNGGAVKITGGG